MKPDVITRYEVQMKRSPKPKSTYVLWLATTNRQLALREAQALQKHNPSRKVRIQIVQYQEISRKNSYEY